MSKAYPRRRDVRVRLLDIFDVLTRYYDVEEDDFDTEFLTSVRDYMREGADLETSIQASEDFPHRASNDEGSEEEIAAFIAALREAALDAAGVPEEDEWDPPEDDGEEGSDYNYDY